MLNKCLFFLLKEKVLILIEMVNILSIRLSTHCLSVKYECIRGEEEELVYKYYFHITTVTELSLSTRIENMSLFN